jgi:hypothetical protein
MEEIRNMVEFEKQNADATIWKLFKPPVLHRTHIGVSTQIFILYSAACGHDIYPNPKHFRGPRTTSKSCFLTGMNVMMYYITVSAQSCLELKEVD